MKRAHLLAAIGAILFLVVSCQKTPTAEVSISQNELTASAMGGNISVNVSSNVDLTVRISVPWITQTGAPSGGGGLYSFNVERNSSYDPRTATITFSNGELGVSETVNVIQSQQDAIIPGKLEYELFYEAQTFTLPISANVDYTVSLDGGDWIKSLGTRGLSSKQYQFSIAENTGKTPREAVLNISSERMKQSIKIVQLPTTHRPVTKEEREESVSFTNKLVSDVQRIKEQFESTGSGSFNVEAFAKAIRDMDGVIHAELNDEKTTLLIMQRDSTVTSFSLLDVDSRFKETSLPPYLSRLIKDVLIKQRVSSQTRSSVVINNKESIEPSGKKALILAPFYDYMYEELKETEPFDVDGVELPQEELMDMFYRWFQSTLIDMGYSVKFLINDQANLDSFRGDFLDDFDLILLETHGVSGFDNDEKPFNLKTKVAIREPYNEKTLEKGIGNPHYEDGKAWCCLTSEWFKKEAPAFMDSFIFLIVCQSFERKDLADALLDKGAGAFIGFSKDIYRIAGQALIGDIWNSMFVGMNLDQAIDRSKQSISFSEGWSELIKAKTNDNRTGYLVNPTPSSLSYTPNGNTVSLTWETATMPYYNELRRVNQVYVDGNRIAKSFLNDDTANKTSWMPTSPGEHKWYVISSVMDGDKVVVSYKSAEEKFEVKGETVAVTGVKIRPSTVSIEPGETYQLTATVMPENASNKAVEWKSNHPELVSVDENGLITAIKRQAGTTVYITAKTVDGGKSSTCQVTVKEPSGGEVAVTGISLNQTSAELEVGKTLQLKSTITPSNATNKSVQWTSSNSAVASVDINGLVTAKAIGTVQITAKTEDGGKTATVSITVKNASEQNVPVTGVSINMSSLSLKVGESATLTTTIAPANATNKGVTWTTSMSSVATVTSDGVVTAKAAGTAVITAKTDDGGKTATCNVTVTYTPDPGGEVSVTQVTISPTSVNMTVGDTKQFSVKIDPANATNQEVSWSSSDPSVASIDSKGLVTAKAEGKATITVTANDGGVSSKATVTVNNKTVPVTGVSVSPASLSMEIGESKALSVTVSPSDATDKTYTVTSDNTGVVDIDNSNNIVAKGAGTANVLITTSDGGFTAKCVVTVNKPQMTISVEPSSLAFGDVNVGESSSKTFSISNTGKAEVKVSGISVPEAYSVDVTTPFTVAVGQSKTVTVTFTPTDGKDYNGSITITSDADSQPTVAVSGKGIEQSAEALEAVDLGLSVKWANMNLGATRSEEFGDYYAWGETEPKTSFSSDNYTKANLTVLKPEDDAAHVKLGGKWRMPTKDEVHELLYSDKCTYSFTTINENNCAIITSKVTGNSIALPAAGLNPGNVYNVSGFYWTSTPYEYSKSRAYYMYYVHGGIPEREEWDYPRYIGMSIRPVYGDFVISVESVSLDKTELELSVGETASLTASIIPSNATNTSVTWSSSNTSVATVSSKGVVTGVSVGTATITVTTSDREKTTNCTVTVTKPAKSISVSPSSLDFGDVNVDETASKTFTISNTGKADVTVSGISVPGGFTSDANVPFSIAVGASKTVTVTFSPTEGKAYSGTISITSDADNMPTVALSGVSTPSAAVPEAVDLGLSVKWASFNLGASIPEDYGYIFSWGYTYPSDYITSNDYKWYVGSNTYTKYYNSSFDGTDNKKVLDPEDDAAHVLLGNNWRIPTREEQEELLNNCERKWTTKNNAYGYLITGPNGNSIFLPARGDKDTGSSYGKYGGCYWSSSLYSLHANAYCIFFQASYSFYVDDQERYKCHAIRPVMDK